MRLYYFIKYKNIERISQVNSAKNARLKKKRVVSNTHIYTP